ncbi:MAG: hypothetical protein LQ352_003056 [Teloschistes flavicans]|nr:MAG: hypothetical protein LQ352_003056 [Teloschistes flavicans]
MISKGQTKATRPEDLVYSVLGIASDSETCGIEIDYSKHYTTVYAEMALLFLKSLGAHALAFSGQLDRGSDPDGCRLPSWVPDLRLKGGFYRYFKLDNPKPRLFSAAGQSSFTYHVDEKFKVLSVRTLKVDSVVEVGKVVNLMVSVDSIFDIHSSLFSAQQTWLKDFAHFLDVAFERYRWSNHDLGWYLDNIELYRKVPFVTKTGYIGLGHENMVVGDEVHLVQGSDTPFILRNTDGRYELVGGTYVHGIMDGELFDDSIRFEEVQLH